MRRDIPSFLVPDSDLMIELTKDNLSKHVLENAWFFKKQHMTPSYQRVMDAIIYKLNNCAYAYMSQQELANITGGCRQTVNRAIGVLSKYGIINKIYRANHTCLYGLPSSLRKRSIREKLSKSFKVFLCATIGSLLSFSVDGTIKAKKDFRSEIVTQNTKKDKYNTTLSSNYNRVPSSSRSLENILQKIVGRASKPTQEVRPIAKRVSMMEVKAWQRDSSYHEMLVIKGRLYTGYEDPFKDDYRAKKYAKRRSELIKLGVPLDDNEKDISTKNDLNHRTTDLNSSVLGNIVIPPPCEPKPLRSDFDTELPNVSDYPMSKRAEIRKKIRYMIYSQDANYANALRAWEKKPQEGIL